MVVVTGFLFWLRSAPWPPAPKELVEPYVEKTDFQSDALIFPEAIVMYSINTFYNNRITDNCQPDVRATLEIQPEMSRFNERMMLRCPNGAEAGRELHALIVGARSEDPTNNPAKFVAFVDAGERIKMMTVTQLLLIYVADQLESLTRYEFAPYRCPSQDTVEFGLDLNPAEGTVHLLADRLTTTSLADGSRYLKYDEVVAAWRTTRAIAALRAGCLPAEEVDGAVAQFQELLSHLYKGEVK